MLRGLFVCVALAALVIGCSGERGGRSSGSTELTLEQALGQLAALPVPDGVSADQFAALKQSLATALQASGKSRFVSAAPSGSAGAVSDLTLTIESGLSVRLYWTYRNKGDYDQNKQVNISDLTPLGANLNKNSAAPDWLERAIAADGDGNLEVNISDITPIGANFFGTVAGYEVQTSATPEVESSWSAVADILFETSTIPEGSALRVFSHQLTAVSNAWYRVVPYDGTSYGAPSNPVKFGLIAPDVTEVNPTTGIAGEAETFAAVQVGGTPQTWAWDFGGGAVPNTAATAQPSVTIGAAGVYDASVTVSNAVGSDTFDFTLTVVNPELPVIEDVQPRGGSEDETVTFSATLSGGLAATFSWDFGGGAEPNLSSEIAPEVLLTTEGTYPASLTVSNAGGSDTFDFTLTVNAGPNLGPSASFTASPQRGDPGEPVALDASGSTDADGMIIKYEWDLDDDGDFELDGGTDPLAAMALPDPAGTVQVTLRVTDNDGATASAARWLSSLPPGWYPQTLDDAGDAGKFPSLALIDGLPAISYLEKDEGDLKYLRARNPEGSSWGDPVTVDSESNVGHFTSLLEVNGHPAISYYDGQDGDLLYVRASDPQGAAWGAPRKPDSAGIVGNYTSLAIIVGFPAIAYLDTSSKAAKFVRANDANGDTWGGPKIAATGTFAGNFTSLAVSDGMPGISYIDQNPDGQLMYVRALTAEGGDWDTPTTVEDASSLPINTSLLIADGLPAIAYCDAGGGDSDLMFVRATNAQGSAWGTPQIIDEAGVTGRFPAMALVDGRPAISYWDFTNQDLKFVQASAADGSAWEAPVIVDSDVTWGILQYNSLREINGMAAVAYHDYETLALKYAVLLP